MAAHPPLKSRLGKSALSIFLRTNCDRELYFSIYKSNRQVDLIACGMPAPLSARPNIELVTSAGIEFEAHELEMLLAEIGAANVRCSHPKPGKFDEVDLTRALSGVPVPSFVLQPGLDPSPFRKELLTRDFGLSGAEEVAVPELSGLRPDILIVRPRGNLQWEVLPTGKRKLLLSTDSRIALSVVDIKNTMEGNKSYAAEVVLYSIFLAKWLEKSGCTPQFFVSDECFLWTHNEKGALSSLPAGASLSSKIDALINSLELVEFAVIAPSVVKFFKEDIPRIAAIGSASGWQSTDFHVGPKCSNCDWLGFDKWLSSADKALLAANPTWYCHPGALSCDHLSQIPNVSRGARQVLEAEGVATVKVEAQADAVAKRVHQWVKFEGLGPDDVVVLVARRPKSVAYALLRQRGEMAGVEWGFEAHGQKKSVLVDTVARFKGLEAQAVVLWVGDEIVEDESWETVYVGATRAKTLLAVIGSQKVVHSIRG